MYVAPSRKEVGSLVEKILDCGISEGSQNFVLLWICPASVLLIIVDNYTGIILNYQVW